jgi:hypothetical protein
MGASTASYRDNFTFFYPQTEAGHEFNAQPLHSIELEHYARVECSVATSRPRTTEQNSPWRGMKGTERRSNNER